MMANLREPYAASSLASLAWSETQEKAIDRVAASGRASTLGVALWKARYMLEADAYLLARSLLRLMYIKRYRSDSLLVVDAFVNQALIEFTATPCVECNGTGERMVDDHLLICNVCSGSRLRRYSDQERARCMRLSYAITQAFGYKLRWLLETMQSEDAAVNRQMNIELERVVVIDSPVMGD